MSEHGMHGFMAGLQARLFKIGIGQAVIFFTYEQVTQGIRQLHSSSSDDGNDRYQ
jgi:hypothetical protein